MSKIFRILVACLIALMPVASVLAQADEIYCGTLAAADCDLLRANRIADAGLTSLTYELEITMSVVQDVVDAQPMSFTISSAGALAYDKADLDAMTDEILNTTIGEVLDLLNVPDALLERITGYVERLVRAPTADVHVDLALPEGLEDGIQSLSADVKMTDGVIYLTSPLLAMADLPPGAWVSLDLVGVVNMLVEMLQDPALVESLMSGMEGGVAAVPQPPAAEIGGEGPLEAGLQTMFDQFIAVINAPYWEEMESPEFLAQIETITRLPDSEVDGVPAAVFEDRLDMAALVTSDPYQQAFNDMFDLFAQDVPPEELEAIKPIILDMLAGMELVSIQVIGLEDHFTYRIDMSWSMTVDPQTFLAAGIPEEERAAMPEEALAAQTQTFVFRQEIRNHNQPVIVTPPPAEAVISLLAMLMGWPPPA